MAENSQVVAMRKLGFSEEEIKDVLACDKRIDRGEKLFEQTAEEKAVTKAMAQAQRSKSPPVYTFTQRERKVNATKEGIIAELAELLKGSQYAPMNITIANKSREVAFVVGDKNYSLTLVEHRQKK